ncbi:MAG: DUF3280 domain-containing protein [Steroidobacteraceae bacterium]
MTLLIASDANADMANTVKLAVFDFELEDFSGGADLVGETPDDTVQLKATTTEARRLLTQSGRYVLADTGSVDAEPVKKHSLRSCNGCDADIALKLGAEQSLVGVITRISRVEYKVQIQIRDAHTGAVVFQRQSDLRMGANYSWNRGAASLIRNNLLEEGRPSENESPQK